MEYFFYCRDKAGTGALRKANTERHWAFMDGYTDRMIARGPTLAADGVTQTGSMHIVDLPDAEAARVFAFEEPYCRAGVFEEVIVRRWRNGTGRSMWDYQGDAAANQRFLVLGQGKSGTDEVRNRLLDAHRQYLTRPDVAKHVILRGPLLDDGGSDWVGSVILLEYPDRQAAEAMLAQEPFTLSGLFERVEVLPWRFGGRR